MTKYFELKIIPFLLLFFTFLVLTCKNDNKTPSLGSNSKVEKRIPAVCVVDDASLRAAPTSNSEWITAVAIGERLTWLGISENDTVKESREYYKVELMDSTVGWMTSYAIELHAQPAVAIREARIFRRPQIVTQTDLKFEPMEYFVVLQTDTDWLEVVGKNRKKSGWIERSAASLKDEDIAVGILASKAMEEKDKKTRFEKLEDIIQNPAFAHSVFIDELILILNDFKE